MKRARAWQDIADFQPDVDEASAETSVKTLDVNRFKKTARRSRMTA